MVKAETSAREIPVGQTGIFPCLECGDLILWMRSASTSSNTPSRCRACTLKRKRERYYASPAYARDQERKAAKNRATSRVGSTCSVDCERCGENFSYVFKQKQRSVCDLCRSHDARWQMYGLTGPQARDLYARAHCEICGRTENPGGRFNQWHIDHDHDTGTVRGLLCAPCNTVLGLMGSDPARLRSAADYIERST